GTQVRCVGACRTASGARTLLEQWDGVGWSRVASPRPTSESALAALSAVSPSDVWAVGSSGTGSVKTLIEHWNGRSWSKVASPNLSSESQLLGVSAQSSRDVWAVGYYGTSSGHR